MADQVNYSKGLAGVIADESKICYIDGEKGRLYYRGYSIYDVAEHDASFGEVAYLLFHGELPTREALQTFREKLRSRRSIPAPLLKMIQAFPAEAHPMAALQTAVAALDMYDEVPGKDYSDQVERAIHLTAKLPTLVAAFVRARKGLDFVAPDPELGHAANFLYMINGERPTEQAARTFEVALILHMEHSFNASTFTGRVVAATMTTMYASVSAAVGALAGPLHGGANEGTLYMIDEIGSIDNVEAYVKKVLENKGRIMGMGHRVYKAKDPRSVILEGMLKDLVEQTGNTRDFSILKKVEEVMRAEMEKRGKDVWPNVDFFSGALYRMLGIETDIFTTIFAIARVVGWTAHILELWQDNRLYRPRALYVGELDKSWVPVGERG